MARFNWLKRKPVTPVYNLPLPESEYLESIQATVGTEAVLFFKYPPVAVSFNQDATRIQGIMGGTNYHAVSGDYWNEQCLQFVQANMNEIRAALKTTVCICDK